MVVRKKKNSKRGYKFRKILPLKMVKSGKVEKKHSKKLQNYATKSKTWGKIYKMVILV